MQPKSDARTRTHSQSFAKQISLLEISHEVLSECDASPHRFRSLSIIYSARVDN
jgi:hypothetical protein